MNNTGYFLYVSICSVILISGHKVLACQQSCAICSGNSQNCERCKNGYWLNYKQCSVCPDQCEQCMNTTHCTVCTVNYWDNRPYIACGSLCNPNCGTGGCNDVTGVCNDCRNGYFGPQCEYNCNLCLNGECSSRRCVKGCVAGYYEDALRDYKCSICSKNCTLCKNQSTCLQCQKGYYLLSYTNSLIRLCQPCVLNCEECYSIDRCISCIRGKYGQTCVYDCNISNCLRCSDHNGEVICTECVNGFVLNNDMCVAESRNCASSCLTISGKVTCNLRDGSCLNGCVAGYWDESCHKQCSEGCTSCDQMYGFCDKCIREFYGEKCQFRCSEQCDDDSSTTNICTRSDGKCMLGCRNGYKGDTCDEEDLQGETTTDVSLRTPSTIVNDGNEGHASFKDKKGLIVGVGSATGVVVTSIVAVVFVCFVKRQRRKNISEEAIVDGQGTIHNEPIVDNIYTKPDKARPKKNVCEDYIYAQPNKPNKKTRTDVKDKGDSRTVYCNIAFDTAVSSEHTLIEEGELDEILLESIDDDFERNSLAEVEVPVSDTYYNMAGLVRSRVQLTELRAYIEKKSNFENEFEILPQGLTRTCNEALKPKNRYKNRFNGIYAYDSTRVMLKSERFINANYIEGYKQSQVSYIASLGPTKRAMHNFETFWEMVWQHKTNKIIMLTNLEESKKTKCEQYWPDGRSQIYVGSFIIHCTAENVYSDFVVRQLVIEKDSKTQSVTQYHYSAWPDKTVPDSVGSLIDFRDKVEQDQTVITGPVVVHCSAGIGRTGTYIALDILVREGKAEKSVDVFGCLIALRGQRVRMVQTVEQYVFLHHSLLYVLTCDPWSIPVAAISQIMTNEAIAKQFKTFLGTESLRLGDVSLMSSSQTRNESRGGKKLLGDFKVPHTQNRSQCIDAVYINGYVKRNKFIVTQTPSPNTVEDFLSMLYREKCSCVVSLDDQNTSDNTLADYIPPTNNISTFGHFKVECTGSDSKDDFSIRKLKMSQIGSPQEEDIKIHHFQLKRWSDSNSVPNAIQPFLTMIENVEKTSALQPPDMPIAVHCKNGTERSDLFSVVFILMEKVAVEKELSVLNTVSKVRARRWNAVKDIEQMQFCYDCVTEMCG